MSARYQAAICGYGSIWNHIRQAFGTRFAGIKAFILIPQDQEKLELKVTFNVKFGKDVVTLIRRNWRTGEESVLYKGWMVSNVTQQKTKRE